MSPPTPSIRRFAACAAAALLAAACTSGGSGGDATGGSGGAPTGGTGGTGGSGGAERPPPPPITEDLQGRNYAMKVPPGYDAATPAPLLVMLHGYTDAKITMDPASGMDAYMHMSAETDERGILLALPRGSYDPIFNRYFWNGTDSCCDINELESNDIGYLMAMVSEIESEYSVDPKRIFFLGHSNGGFMAHRVACDAADRVAGVVSLAGAVYKDPEKCAAPAPIAVLQVHGDADPTVPYEGGPPIGIESLPPAPGAVETVEIWAAKNRCSGAPDTSPPPIDVVENLDGAETHKTVYKGCEANGGTELWTIAGGPHSPNFNDAWAASVLDFLMAHPKP
jgi:polyhydroxybutyrate depolymerase